MSNITITLEVKPSQELVTLFAPVIAAIMPKAPAPAPAAQVAPIQQYQQLQQQYQVPVNPTPAQQPSIPATPVTPAPTVAPARTPYPSNPAPVNPTYAPTQGAVVAPAAAQPIVSTFPNATNSAMPAAPVTTSAVPTATPGNAVPTAAAPAYQFDDLARAAAQLMDAGKQQNLLGLLGQFGLQSMQQLPKERYGEFATALRQLGARI